LFFKRFSTTGSGDMNFVFPVFLYGLLLVSIPVIIHFFNFQRARRVYFTNVAFLATVKQVTNSRNKLRNLLVMLARMLFILFMVLAFAQPYLTKDTANTVARSPYVSIYFDNSYSLQNEMDGKRLFDVGLSYIEQLAGVFSNNTLFQLLDNSFDGNLSFFIEKEKLLDKITEERFSNTGRELQDVLTRQKASLSMAGSEGGNQVFWISDFQRTSVGDLSAIEFDSANTYYLIPLVPENRNNLYVDSVWLENPFIKEQENNNLFVKVVNSGTASVEDKVIQFFMEDKQVASSTVTIPASGFEVVQMNFSVNEPGEKRCRILLDDFPITFDNEHHFVLKVAPNIRVVHIASGNGDFIESVYATETFFQIASFNISSFDYSSLNTADLVVLDNLSEIDNAMLASLQRALARGIGLVVFPGKNPDENTLGNLLQIPVSSLDVKSADLDKPEKMIGVLPPSEQDPFFTGVFERVTPNMNMPKGIPVISWPATGNNLLRYRNELPFLTVLRREPSRIYLFSSPLDLKYGDFARHALFVPVMYKIALNSKMKNDRLSYYFSEPVAVISLDSLQKNDIFKLANENYQLIPAQRLVGNNLLLNIPRYELEAGTYGLQRNNSTVPASLIAFNYDNEESQLDYYNAEELKSLFAKFPNVQVFQPSDETQLKKEFEEKNIAQPLWRYMLLLALLFLLAETLLIRFWKGV
jgi:hypothetical protein